MNLRPPVETLHYEKEISLPQQSTNICDAAQRLVSGQVKHRTYFVVCTITETEPPNSKVNPNYSKANCDTGHDFGCCVRHARPPSDPALIKVQKLVAIVQELIVIQVATLSVVQGTLIRHCLLEIGKGINQLKTHNPSQSHSRKVSR